MKSLLEGHLQGEEKEKEDTNLFFNNSTMLTEVLCS